MRFWTWTNFSPCMAIAAVVVAGSTLTANAAWIEVDDFQDGFGFNGVDPVELTNQNGWAILNPALNKGSNQIVADPVNGANAVLRITSAQTTGTALTPFKSVAAGQGIGENSTGTIYFRFNMDTPGSLGFGMVPASTSVGTTVNAAAVLIGNGDTNLYGYQPSTTSLNMQSLATDTWYSLWMTVNNPTGNAVNSDIINFFIQGGAFATPTQLSFIGPPAVSNFTSRTSYAAELVKLGLRTNVANVGATLYFDDFYVDNAGVNVTIPVPEPNGLICLGLATSGLLTFTRRRSKR
jgi:hypothetical protein